MARITPCSKSIIRFFTRLYFCPAFFPSRWEKKTFSVKINRIKIFRFLGPSDLSLTAYNIRHASGYYLIKENLNIQQTSPHPRSRKVQRCPVMCAKVKLRKTLNGKAAGQFKKPNSQPLLHCCISFIGKSITKMAPLIFRFENSLVRTDKRSSGLSTSTMITLQALQADKAMLLYLSKLRKKLEIQENLFAVNFRPEILFIFLEWNLLLSNVHS